MKCPHCTVEFHSQPSLGSFKTFHTAENTKDPDRILGMSHERCPSCSRLIVQLWYHHGEPADGIPEKRSLLVYPKTAARPPLSLHVPKEYAQDYREAALVLNDSPKASAALSRRCLQHVLLEGARTTERKDLSKQITEVLPTLPGHLRDLLDSLRVIGNFAAHPLKSTSTGEIIGVEPGEAELLLDVLEMVFDFYFVQPTEAKKKRDAINAKLVAAGKPEMK